MRSALDNLASSSFALPRMAPSRSAPRRSALLRYASFGVVRQRLAPRKSAQWRHAFMRLASLRLALRRSAPVRSARCRWDGKHGVVLRGTGASEAHLACALGYAARRKPTLGNGP